MSLIPVTLQRDGPSTPWGFRLHGGKDVGSPLVIQRVFMGSPSEGELHRGDVILQVSERDAGNLTHMEAHDSIKSAGNRLQLLVHRLPGAPQSPAATPTSPASFGSGHPLSNIKAKSFQPMLPHKTAPPVQQSAAQPWNRPTYSPVQPLPTSPVPVSQPPFFTPTPQNFAAAELLEHIEEKHREKESIVNQGYRSVPLISPKPKARHDIPIGSYLRHVRDPTWKTRPSAPPAKPFMMSYQPSQSFHRREPERIPMATTNEGTQIVNLQYNTPYNLYSHEAVTQTIKEQTGMQPKPKQPTAAPVRNPPAANPAVNPSGPLSPNSTGGSLVAPAKPGTKLQNIVDITLSPTFQLLQEEEQRRSASPRPEPRTPPTMSRSPLAMAPRYEEERISPLGTPRDMIHQSGSFKTLMATLAMTGGGQQEF